MDIKFFKAVRQLKIDWENRQLIYYSQVFYDSGVRYIPNWIPLSITVRYADYLDLVPNHIMTSQLESPCSVIDQHDF